MTTGLTSFTTTHWVIYRVHYYATVTRTATEPAATACFTRFLQCVVGVSYYTHSSLASCEHFAELT